ncbi:MAG: two-component system response regulator, partial [Bacteroidetes bacterium]|nr:two-component system response regulator [Bacteroidota bacterium]
MESEGIDVILVEDSSDDAMLVKRAFKSHHLRNKIIHLKNGQEAIDYIFNEQMFDGSIFSINPKVILLDLNMPKVSGIDVLKRLKSNEETRTIPVVILTSSAEDPDIKSCYALGANSYIVKPVEFENF